MAFEQKYGYARLGGKAFVPGGQPRTARRDSCESPEERKARDREYFFSRFGWFWERRGTILAMPEIYGVRPLFSGLSLAYIGGGPLSLGALFRLWGMGRWTAVCPECGGEAFIYFAGGSPLSGANRCEAYCTDCGTYFAGQAETFSELWRPAKELIEREARADVAPAAEAPARTAKKCEDFRAISRRWRAEYDEKSEAELEQAARERKERREAERLRAPENLRNRDEQTEPELRPLPSERAEALLKKLENTEEEMQ